jgi:tRNA threonylcarbamoyladenosine biosynthesis protein TsaB
MKVLALDTATAACSAALLYDGEIVAARFEKMARGHSEALMAMVADVMDKGRCDFSELGLVATTKGPGAFTGLRIGLAAARGFALAAKIPCLGVTTFEALACGVTKSERYGRKVLVVMDAKRSDVYAQMFDVGLVALSPPLSVRPEELVSLTGDNARGERIIVAGDLAERTVNTLRKAGISSASSRTSILPDASVVAKIAARQFSMNPAIEYPPPSPLYLRPPDASLPKDGGRLRPSA